MRGWANTTEGKKLLEGVVETAASIRFWRHQNGTMRSRGRELKGVTTDTETVNSSKDWSEPLQNKILRIITSKTKGAAKWKTLLNGRKFRAASAVHYMNCLHSANTSTIPLIKFRGNEDKIEDTKNLVRHVVKCIQNRQMRHTEHLLTRAALSDTATKTTEKVMEEITEQIRDGQMEDIRQFLEQGEPYGEECQASEMQTDFRRLPKEHVASIYQDAEQTLSNELRDKMQKATDPKRTTRIRGQIALGEWSGVIGKKHEDGPNKGEPIELTEENCQFYDAQHEDDMLIDTGCSFTIMSQDWLEEYCSKNKLDIGSVLIKYPEGYAPPAASTAAENSTVKGIGFARVKLRIVTLPTGFELEWSEDGMSKGRGTSVMEIATYVHVFAGMGSPWLLGMPFIQQFTSGWDTEANQVVLKDNQGLRGSVPLHPTEEVPMRPVMVCTKEDIHLRPHSEVDIQGYTIGTASFPDTANFQVTDEQGNGQWANANLCEEGGEMELVKLDYGIEPIQNCGRLHRGGFATYGVDGTRIPNEELSSPKMKIRSEDKAIEIPAGTPVGLIVQRCRGIPTYRWGKGYALTKLPKEIKREDRSQVRAIPSQEIQKACEYNAAVFWENTIRGVTEQAETGIAGDAQDEAIRQILRQQTLRQGERIPSIQESLEDLRDGCGTKQRRKQMTPQDKMKVCQGEFTRNREKKPAKSERFERAYSRVKAGQDERKRIYDEGRFDIDQDASGTATEQASKLAKMLVQMLWHLMGNTKVRANNSEEEEWSRLTNRAKDEKTSHAMKRLLKHFRSMIKTNEWVEWMKEHEEDSAVHALKRELEADTYEIHVTEENSDYEEDSEDETDTEVCQVRETRAEQTEIRRAVQTEAGKQIEEANKDLDALREMLTNDTAAGGDVMAAIMEQPVSIVEFFQKKDKDGNLQECPDGKGWEKRDIGDIMNLIDEEWAAKIKEACKDKVENDNNVQVEDEHRINRMAAYMMMVDTASIKDDTAKVRLLFDYILRREPFYNINPNNPPRFVGQPFDYVRMKPDETSISHQERRIPPSALKPVLEQIKEWMQQGVVEKSNSPHSSPLLLVKKKALSPPLMADGQPDPDYVAKVRWRTCVDYVQLNQKSAPTDISNAPRVDELLDYIGLAGSHKMKQPGEEYWVSTIDLYAGFNQWYLSEEVRPLTAFTVPGLAAEEGRLQFRVLPFGLASAPTRFNSLVAETLGELRFGHHNAEAGGVVSACCTNYIDDVFVADICTFEQHLKDMDQVFERLQKAGFGARMDKAEFCRHEISMLGWTIAEGYKSAQESKIEKIDEMLDTCADVKDVLSLLGTVGFYRQLIPMSGDIEAPLYDLTKKGAWSEDAWTPVHTACVKLLKYHLKEQVKLAIPRIGKDATGKDYPPMQLATDASQYAGGAVLFQEQADGVERPICFASKTFTKEQRNWSATERELWTLMHFACEHFRQFFIGGTPTLYTDHKPLTYLFKNRNTTNAKIARWSAKLSKLRANVEYRAGAKMGPADTFSRMMKDRPERARRDLETPENRDPVYHPRGDLQEFEPEDTKERTISLPREAGIPQQRVMFWKGIGAETEQEHKTAESRDTSRH